MPSPEALEFAGYPVRGAAKLLRTRSLWREAASALCCGICATIVSTGLVFGLLLVPQALLIINLGAPEWAAWLSAVLLCLLEVLAVTIIVLKGIFGCFIDKLQDIILERGNVVFEKKKQSGCGCGMDLVEVIFGILLFALTFPLNAIPILGTIAFFMINGWLLAWELQRNYFDEKDVPYAAQLSHMLLNAIPYGVVGMIMILLQLIPGVGLFFFFSNAVGMAQLCCDIEFDRVAFNRSDQTAKHFTARTPTAAAAAPHMDEDEDVALARSSSDDDE